MAIKIGCGPITWPKDLPEDDVLDDMHKAGYEGAMWRWHLGAGQGDPQRSPEDISATLARHELKAAPSSFPGRPLWESARREEFLSEARRLAEVSAALGLHDLYVYAGGFDRVMPSGRTRKQAAGHVTPEDVLPKSEFAQLVDVLNSVAAATMEYDVHCCYHPHVGTVIETEEEIEDLLSQVDRDLVALGPDTGHLTWAGLDAVDFCRRHLKQIRTMHVKDINCAARDRGREEGWDYDTYAANGVFTELATGCVDFRSLFSLLSESGFSGWLIVETDVTQLSSPLESAIASREKLRQFGL